MQNFIFKDAKKALCEQKDIRSIASVISNYKYKPYFHILTYKYFTDNPKKEETRQDYNEYYRTVNDKLEIEDLSSYFDRMYNDCLKSADNNKLYKVHIENLEKIIAQYEIAVCKTVSMCQSPLNKEYLCSKEYIIKCMNNRDSMIKKIEKINDKTFEYRELMRD